MARRSQRNVGVIGLGIIGTRVMENLRRKGFHVFVWNRSPRPVPNFVGAPAEVAEMCDVVQIFVSDDDALLEMTKQIAPGLAPRHLVLAHSTVAPHSMRAAADIVERRGARFVEAPFTGSKVGAEKGELVYYVAGDEQAVRDARPVLEASGKEVIEFGAIGQATAIKIATNIITAATIQAAAEALALMHSAGIPSEKFATAMESNAINSTTLSLKLAKMVEGKFDPHFSVKHMLKDMQIANRLGLLNHLELSVTAAARDRLLEQMQRGFGDEDFAAVARKYFHQTRAADQKDADLELFEQPASLDQAGLAAAIAAANAANTATNPEVRPAPAEPQLLRKFEALSPDDSVVAESEREKPEVPAQSALEATESSASRLSTSEESNEPERRGFFDRLLRRGTDY